MNIFKLIPKPGVRVTKQLAADISLAEAHMAMAFKKAKRKKKIYDIVCAVSVGSMTDDEAKEQIKALNIDE